MALGICWIKRFFFETFGLNGNANDDDGVFGFGEFDVVEVGFDHGVGECDVVCLPNDGEVIDYVFGDGGHVMGFFFCDGALVDGTACEQAVNDGDIHAEDGITTEGFGRIATPVARLGLPTVLVQEGGYPCPELGANLASFLAGYEGA